jgi:hypothetical protein
MTSAKAPATKRPRAGGLKLLGAFVIVSAPLLLVMGFGHCPASCLLDRVRVFVIALFDRCKLNPASRPSHHHPCQACLRVMASGFEGSIILSREDNIMTTDEEHTEHP